MKKLELTDELTDELLEQIGEADHAFVFESDKDYEKIFYVRADMLFKRIRLFSSENKFFDSIGEDNFEWFRKTYNVYLLSNIEFINLLENN